MGEIIEHGDNGSAPSVRVGEGGSLIPVKVYQDIYHQAGEPNKYENGTPRIS